MLQFRHNSHCAYDRFFELSKNYVAARCSKLTRGSSAHRFSFHFSSTRLREHLGNPRLHALHLYESPLLNAPDSCDDFVTFRINSPFDRKKDIRYSRWMKHRRTSRLFASLGIFLSFPLWTPLVHSASDAGRENTNSNAVTVPHSPQNAEDQFLLGRAYYRGEGVNQSYEQAGAWYRKSAEQGNLKAMHNLGIMFLEGQGTKKDESEGYRWIRMAAEKGDPRASYLCGVLLLDGKGVKKNPSEGVEWLRKSASKGYANAVARLGRDYFYGGDGLTPNPKQGLSLIQSASEKGNAWAMGTLGEIYKKGELLTGNAEKARELFQRGAELGDPASQYQYASLLMLSNPIAAYPWIKLAVDAHEVRAIGLMNDACPHMTSQQRADGDAMAEKIREHYLPKGQSSK